MSDRVGEDADSAGGARNAADAAAADAAGVRGHERGAAPEHAVAADPEALRRLTVHDADGRRVGPVTEVYVDDWSRRPEWVAVRAPRADLARAHPGSGATEASAAQSAGTGTGASEAAEPPDVFVPLRDARQEPGGVLRVAHRLDAIERAPALRADQHLGLDQEQELYAHYGLTPPAQESSGAPGVGGDRPKAPLTGPARAQVASEVRELADEPPAAPPRLRRFTATDPDDATVSPSGVHGDNR